MSRVSALIFVCFALAAAAATAGCADPGRIDRVRAGAGNSAAGADDTNSADENRAATATVNGAVAAAVPADGGGNGDGDGDNNSEDDSDFGATPRATVAALPAALAPASEEILLREPEGDALALLAPLSGESAALGEALVDAVALAVADHAGGDGAALTLAVIDTGATPDSAARAAEEALAAGAGLVLGPLFADAAEAAGRVLTPRGVSLLSFSNDSRVSRQGVFILGQTPQSQLAAVIQHALDSGLRDFAIFAPRTPLGFLARDALRAYRDEGSLRILGEGFYPAGSLVPDEEVRDFLRSSLDYEALILPASGQALQGVVNAFAFHDPFIDEVQILGLTALGDEVLRGEPALHGAWFSAPGEGSRRQFVLRFERIMGYRPPVVASLAYDAAAIAILLHRGGGGAPWSVAALTRGQGFLGTGGLFRLRRDGISQRSLAIYELTSDGVRERAAAPGRFAVPGFSEPDAAN